jgi:adenine-specific DNA-methyltransferase
LHVLKLLVPSYKNKVKCIYIDPPYNTQNEFIYPDNYATSEIDYLLESGQIEEGQDVSGQNTKEKNTGRKHSNWLSFMYPRLVLARELLCEDGVIFVSIDDNEVHHLKHMMNEIFGEECGLIPIIWKKGNAQNDAIGIQKNHEYILGYFKDEIDLKYSDKTEKKLLQDENGWFYLGSGLVTGGAGGTLVNRLNLGYSIYFNKKTKDFIAIDDYDKELAKTSNDEKVVYQDNQDLIKKGYTKIIRPPKKNKILGRWTWSMEKINNSKKFIHITENYSVVQKIYIDNPSNKGIIEIESELPPKSIIEESSGSGTKILNDIFEGKIFDNPKPVSLIKHLLQISTAPNDLILDFFAGSGTTAQAVMELNQDELNKKAKDGIFENKQAVAGGRRFILVQLPEKIDAKKEAFKAGYKHISDITIERVKRASQKYQNVDNGFKVLELTESAIDRKLMNKSIATKEEIFAEIACAFGYGLNYTYREQHNLGKRITYLEGNNREALVILGEEQIDNQTLADIVLNSDAFKQSQIFAQDECLNVEIIYNLYQHFEQKRVIIL